MNILGTCLIKTCAYHPQANGLCERLNRDIKTALKTKDLVHKWVDNLPLVLMALRSQYKEDMKCSPAEMVFGTTLRLPGEIIHQTSHQYDSQHTYLNDMRQHMGRISYKPPRYRITAGKIDPELQNCTHVYIRIDAVKPQLTRPYSGPYRVLKRNPKYFTLQLLNKTDKVSIDRLKAAILPKDNCVNNDTKPADNPTTTFYRCDPVSFCVPENSNTNNEALSSNSTINRSEMSPTNSSTNSTNDPPRNPSKSRTAQKSRRISFSKQVAVHSYSTRSGRAIKRPVRFNV